MLPLPLSTSVPEAEQSKWAVHQGASVFFSENKTSALTRRENRRETMVASQHVIPVPRITLVKEALYLLIGRLIRDDLHACHGAKSVRCEALLLSDPRSISGERRRALREETAVVLQVEAAPPPPVVLVATTPARATLTSPGLLPNEPALSEKTEERTRFRHERFPRLLLPDTSSDRNTARSRPCGCI